MQKAVLLLNGQPYNGAINCTNAYVICCDGAYDWAKDKLKIDENIGDFDSLPYTPFPPPSEVYPSEKDYTDGEIALHKLINSGYTEIEIYGGSGGREDHFLGNLHLLYYAHIHGVKARMINDRSEIFLGSGKIVLNGVLGVTFSVLPFGGKLHIYNSEGFKYAYPKQIGYGECRGISNVGESQTGYLQIGEDETALIIINKGKV